MDPSLVPIEIWQRIVQMLGPWDALQLRCTCRGLYAAVTYFHSYWYRQFCWYLIKQKKRPAMFLTGCDRKHIQPRDVTCLREEERVRLAAELEVPVSRLGKHPALEYPDGQYWSRRAVKTQFSERECDNASHYIYKLPADRFDIPLDPADYKPNEQLYIYRFLIHNYRHQRQRASHYTPSEVVRQLKEVNTDLIRQKRELARVTEQLKRGIERTRQRKALLREVHHQIRRLENNKVFHGRKSRGYKGIIEEEESGGTHE